MSLAEHIQSESFAVSPTVSNAAREMLALFRGNGRDEIVKSFNLPERHDDLVHFISDLGLIPTVGIAPHEAVGLGPEEVISHQELDVCLASKAHPRVGGSFVVRQVIPTGPDSSFTSYWARKI